MKYKVTAFVRNTDGELVGVTLLNNGDELKALDNVLNQLRSPDQPPYYLLERIVVEPVRR